MGIPPEVKKLPEQSPFSILEGFQRRIDSIQKSHGPTLLRYYNPKRGGFWHRYKESDPNKTSKASTATCVASLIAAGLWVDGEPWFETSQILSDILVSELFAKSSGLPPKNIFSIAFQFEALIALQVHVAGLTLTAPQRNRIRSAADAIRRHLKEDGSARIPPYPANPYLTQLAFRALVKYQTWHPSRPGSAASKTDEKIRQKVSTWAWQQLLYELGLFMSKSKTADAFALAYSVILFATATDLAGLSPPQKQTLRTAIDRVFVAQLKDGSWPRSRPLFHYATLGNAHCYEYEMLTQLLKSDSLSEHFLRHLPRLRLSVQYLQETSFDLGDGRLAWASGHHPQLEGPESWSTASAYHFLHQLGRVTAEAIRQEVFQYAEVPYVPVRPPRENIAEFAPASRFLDAHLIVNEENRSLRDEISTKFLQPLVAAAPEVRRGLPLPRKVSMSLLMFGPPGTSKTTLAELIAEHLGWSFLPIDPSHVVSAGWDRIHATASALFKRLASLDQSVIFLDEFDEMVRERQAAASQPVSRFFTTAMLPQFAAINRRRRSVLIVATNHVEAFDAAILRRGRFDVVVQVMPPHTQAKMAKWSPLKTHLESIDFKIDAEQTKIDALTYSEFEEIVPALEQCTTSQDATNIVSQAYTRCTLLQPITRRAEEIESTTWEHACDLQKNFIRVP